jgi:hypothetical protein
MNEGDGQANPPNSSSLKRRAPFIATLYILFFRPSLVFGVLERETLWRAVLRAVLTAVFCGLVITVARIPVLNREVTQWAEWIEQEMGNLRLDEEGLRWEPAQQLPYGKHFNGWRVSFRGDPEAEFDDQERYGPEDFGLWVSPAKAYLWQRSRNGKVTGRQILDASKIYDALAAARRDEQGAIRVSLEGFNKFLVVLGIVFGVGFFTVAGVVAEVLFYATLFAVLPFLLRTPQARMGLKRAYVFYLHLSLVPMIVAMVYATLRVPFLDFNSVFAFVFLGYLALVIFSARAKIKELQGRGPQ